MDLGDRLRAMGVRPLTRPAAALPDEQVDVADLAAPVPRPVAPPAPLEKHLPGGVWQETPYGRCFVIEHRYALDHAHGTVRLQTLLDLPGEILNHLGRSHEFDGVDAHALLFFDTETTGLAGGTGTYVFLTGLGLFDGDTFVVRQLFMPDLESERALLHVLNSPLGQAAALVSFNGKSFDWPLLEARFTLSRMRPAPGPASRHLDLMHAARRVWKDHLPACTLGDLERNILHLQRHGDVPGWLIPSLYFEYLRTGQIQALLPVFEHNRLDVLSLLGLAGHLGALLYAPDAATLAGAECYGLGRFYEDLGRPTDSLKAYARALTYRLDPALRAVVVQRMTTLYRRLGQTHEALRIWEELVAGETTLIFPYVELAKHYEHRLKDYIAAATLVRRALDICANPWHLLAAPPHTRADLDKRLTRLEAKAARAAATTPRRAPTPANGSMM